MKCKELFFSDHAVSQMFQRNIRVDEVKKILIDGEIIREYFDDRPYPSFLVLGYSDSRPLHLVVARDEQTGRCIIITTYEPSVEIWKAGFKDKK